MRLAGLLPLLAPVALLVGTHEASAEASASSDTIITLQWTAPGDDANVGTATLYDVRMSTAPLTEQNFAFARRAVPLRASRAGTVERFTVKRLQPGVTYYFAIRTCDERVNWSRMSNVFVRPGSLNARVSAGVTPTLPLDFSSPYPNPARSTTHFSLQLPARDDVLIEAFDAMGRRVRTLLAGMQPAGRSELAWDLRDKLGTRLEPGIYLVRARIGSETRSKRVIIVQ
jgi:hypothetical protein